MKIAIVTFWEGSDNYGQTLQAYALQRFLRNKGHDAFIVRYKRLRKRTFAWWLSLPYKILSYLYVMIFKRDEYELRLKFKRQGKEIAAENLRNPRHFELFKKTHINFSDQEYNQYSIFKNPPEADVYIAGSDQIWRGMSPVFFLQFVPKGKPCLAYAPSFGGLKFSHKEKNILTNYLKRFSFLGMRERYGVELCKSLGRDDAMLVMDPTLLLSKEDYCKIMKPVTQQGDGDDYLFLYLLGNDMELDVSAIYSWAEQMQIKIVYVASQGRHDEYPKVYPNVDEWLSLLNGSKYVITNSFHGTVFSIIMNKQFCTIPLTGSFVGMNGRIIDLLSELGMEERLYTGDLNVLFSSFSYEKINQLIDANRNSIFEKINKWLIRNDLV